MKFLLATLILLLPDTSYAEDNPLWPERPFDTAVISYKIKGLNQGSGVLYIKGDYQVERKKVRGKSGSIEYETDEMIITTPDEIYTIDLSDKDGSKTKNPAATLRQFWSESSDEEQEIIIENAEKHNIHPMIPLQAKVDYDGRTIAGQSCHMVNFMGQEYCVWGKTGVKLYEKTGYGEFTNEKTAYNIKKNIEIPDSYFKVPKGVKIRDMSGFSMSSMMMSSIRQLKNPDFEPPKAMPAMDLEELAKKLQDPEYHKKINKMLEKK